MAENVVPPLLVQATCKARLVCPRPKDGIEVSTQETALPPPSPPPPPNHGNQARHAWASGQVGLRPRSLPVPGSCDHPSPTLCRMVPPAWGWDLAENLILSWKAAAPWPPCKAKVQEDAPALQAPASQSRPVQTLPRGPQVRATPGHDSAKWSGVALAVLAPRVWPRHSPFHGSGRRHSAFPPVPLRLVRRLCANPAHPPQRDSGKRTTLST